MVYRTMQGREIDLDKLIRSNELTPAVGNMKVNARGDELDSQGQIVKKREEVVAEYYEVTTPKRKKPTVEAPVQETAKNSNSNKDQE
jgi:hypothetical protein